MWSPSKHGGNNGAGTCRHGGIMPMHRCGGSHNFLKLQKETATKALCEGSDHGAFPCLLA